MEIFLPYLTTLEDGIPVEADTDVAADVLQELVGDTAERLDFRVGQIGLELHEPFPLYLQGTDPGIDGRLAPCRLAGLPARFTESVLERLYEVG